MHFTIPVQDLIDFIRVH